MGKERKANIGMDEAGDGSIEWRIERLRLRKRKKRYDRKIRYGRNVGKTKVDVNAT